MTKPDLTALQTEARHPRTARLDALSPLELVTLIHEEDRTVATAVQQALPRIAEVVEAIAARMRKGGRLFYCGAGTSGRLGVLDAAECPPTFSSPPDRVIGLCAGGPAAFAQSVEGAEDDDAQGATDLRARDVGPKDTVVGIAASGRTPYVLGALRHATAAGALTAAIVCNPGSPVAQAAALPIELATGPEVLTGSTRLKAGTATKMVLNMLSTGAFVLLGKTYGNLMVDLQATNRKLAARSARIVAEATGCDAATAERTLAECDGETKVAIVVLRHRVDPPTARTVLLTHDGSVRRALEALDA
ncbi:MAG: N-acetylmuramic acid 6-phosphate etherase [Planctomycetes bacterium]|nr:N-acetylmuramic acid 6-phosphate etherase [Planctomycetota bacterium]